MKITSNRRFDKQFKKLPIKVRDKFMDVVVVFSIDPHDPVLNNHGLNGKYQNCWSINITGDIRAIYRKISDVEIRFVEIGSHSQLYK